jgi:glutathione S-transferase
VSRQDYEDVRLSFPEFGAKKAAGAFTFGSVPVIDVGSERFAQSGAILRYVGKLSGLYPVDILAAMRTDVVIDALEEL